jgi:putative addiction module component (TIGR02574 family)
MNGADEIMDQATKDLTREALDLPIDDRVILVDALLASLHPSEPSITAAWADEAEARLDAFLQGELKAAPASDVLAKHLQQ